MRPFYNADLCPSLLPQPMTASSHHAEADLVAHIAPRDKAEILAQALPAPGPPPPHLRSGGVRSRRSKPAAPSQGARTAHLAPTSSASP